MSTNANDEGWRAERALMLHLEDVLAYTDCPRCGGMGTIILAPGMAPVVCPDCEGSGIMELPGEGQASQDESEGAE